MKYSLPLRLVAAAALAATTALFVSSCSTAKVTDVWTAPDLTNISFKKIMVIAATKDGATRRIVEDSLGAAIPNIQVVPSYALLADDAQMKDLPKITETLKTAAVDGVIVFRMISDRNEVSVTQNAVYPMGYPMGYRSFGGYYGTYGMAGFGSTTVTTDRIISIEANIYEAVGGKLVWSGVTESTSPGNIKQMVDDAVKAIRAQLVKQNLIAAPTK